VKIWDIRFGSESHAITAGPASEFIDVGLTVFSVLELKGFWKNFSFVEWEGRLQFDL